MLSYQEFLDDIVDTIIDSEGLDHSDPDAVEWARDKTYRYDFFEIWSNSLLDVEDIVGLMMHSNMILDDYVIAVYSSPRVDELFYTGYSGSRRVFSITSHRSVQLSSLEQGSAFLLNWPSPHARERDRVYYVYGNMFPCKDSVRR